MENGSGKRMCQYYCIDCIVTKWDKMHCVTVLFHGIVEPYARAYCCHDYDDMIFFQFYLLICILYFHHNECV